MSIIWPELVFSEKFMKKLELLAAAKVVSDIASKEEAVTYVIEKLSEDDWAKCKLHKGDSSPTTYLYTLSSNLIIEYSRKKFGRVRPPEWLKREGSFWVTVWKELCLDRKYEQTVIDRHCASGFREASTVQGIVCTIKAKIPWCGVSNRPSSIDDDSYSEQSYADDGGTISDTLRRESYDQFLLLAQLILSNSQADTAQPATTSALSKKVCEITESINISSEERLMLRMFYIDGLSHSAIARSLGVAKHVPVRQNKKVLQKLQAAFVQHGIELE